MRPLLLLMVVVILLLPLMLPRQMNLHAALWRCYRRSWMAADYCPLMGRSGSGARTARRRGSHPTGVGPELQFRLVVLLLRLLLLRG